MIVLVFLVPVVFTVFVIVVIIFVTVMIVFVLVVPVVLIAVVVIVLAIVMFVFDVVVVFFVVMLVFDVIVFAMNVASEVTEVIDIRWIELRNWSGIGIRDVEQNIAGQHDSWFEQVNNTNEQSLG